MAIEHVVHLIPRLRRELPELAKLNRLGWVAGMVFNSYGLRVGIRMNDAAILDLLPARLPPERKQTQLVRVDRLYSLVASGSPNNYSQRYVAYANHLRLSRPSSAELMLDTFERNLQGYLAENARSRLFVHAGVVGYQGHAIVMPGRSFRGKSTLVREFVRAGATYYSDEYAAFDRRGRVHPYARALALREGPNGKFVRVAAESFGGHTGHRPLPVKLILVCEYKPRGHWRPRRLSAGQAAMELVANTVAARTRPAEMLDTIHKVLGNAIGWKGVRGEAHDVVTSILEDIHAYS